MQVPQDRRRGRPVAAIQAGALIFALLVSAKPGFADQALDLRPPSLTGHVASSNEGTMEGVLISAQRDGSPISVTVISGADGRFTFPADRVPPGHYALRARAIGYELGSPAYADVAAGAPSAVDLTLRKVDNIAAQLTSTEWLLSMPGTAEQKRPLIECMSCHTLERVVRSQFTANEFVGVLKRMANYANNSTTQRVQARVAEREVPDDRARQVAEYLATVNLSRRDRWNYELKTLPRPTGAATRILITEYDLPRPTIAPHDVRTDANGFVWYSNFVEPYMGRLDPRTGAHTEFAYALPKPKFPVGALALEPDHDGNWWLALMFQGGLMKFDTRKQTFRHFPLPDALNGDTAQQSMVMPRQSHVDGKVWTNDVNSHAILRLDLATGAYESVDPFQGMPIGGNRQHSPYGMTADRDNNLYFMDFGDENVGRVNAKTFRGTIYPTRPPIRGRAAPCSTTRGGCGSRNSPPIRSPCSTSITKASGNGTCRRRLRFRMMCTSTTMASCGAVRCRATACSASIRKPANRSNTCCRGRPISAASSSTIPRPPSPFGPATTTTPPFSRSNF